MAIDREEFVKNIERIELFFDAGKMNKIVLNLKKRVIIKVEKIKEGTIIFRCTVSGVPVEMPMDAKSRKELEDLFLSFESSMFKPRVEGGQ